SQHPAGSESSGFSYLPDVGGSSNERSSESLVHSSLRCSRSRLGLSCKLQFCLGLRSRVLQANSRNHLDRDCASDPSANPGGISHTISAASSGAADCAGHRGCNALHCRYIRGSDSKAGGSCRFTFGTAPCPRRKGLTFETSYCTQVQSQGGT